MRKSFDYYLLAVVFLLLILGIVILTNASMVFSQERVGTTTYYLIHQIIFGIIPGIFFGFVAFKLPMSFFKKWSLLFILLSSILMALVFIPGIGVSSGGATRWLNIRIGTFQPSEILKLSFFMYLSAWLASRLEKIKKENKKKNWQGTLAPFLFILVVITLLLEFQSDATTLGVIIIASIILYFSSGTPIWHIPAIALLGAAGAVLLVIFEPYRIERILVLLGLKSDPMGVGYQIKQILIAIGSGGIFGRGLGMSQQKFGFLPQPMSDSIFAIFAEEAGFIGCLILIFLFLFFLWRGLTIAKKANDKFSQIFATAISCWICIQAFINIGAMSGILPLVGVPLPFVSYGGSHIFSELIAVGILLNISKST